MPRPITPRHVIRFAISVLILIFSFALATEAQAITHDKPDYTPVEVWEASWESRIVVSSLTPAMLTEWHRIHALYPLWTPEPPEPPAPPIPPKPAYTQVRTYPPDVERWRGLVESHFNLPDVPWAMRVMACESNGNPNADNPTSTASGLYQHLRGWWGGAWGYPAFDPFDPEQSVKAAAWLLYNSGAQNWECK